MRQSGTETGGAGWRVSRRTERRILVWGAVAVMVSVAGFSLLDKYWPYRYRNVEPLLTAVLASQITIAHYHRIYFPHPGFVADGVTLHRTNAPGLPPVGTARELRVEGNWGDLVLFRKRVRVVFVSGLDVELPPAGSAAMRQDFPAGSSSDFAGPSTPVETLHVQDSMLVIRNAQGEASRYQIGELDLHNVHRGETAGYVLDMQNAKPSGRIQAHGSFGPLNPKDLGATPVSGTYLFAPANLGDLGELHGSLSASGQFSGHMDGIETTVDAKVADFAVHDGKRVPVTGSAQCTVNALNGDVVLHTVKVTTGATTIDGNGTVAGAPKVTDLALSVRRGRVQDLMQPFVHGQVQIAGPARLTARAHVAPGGPGRTFLQRLSVQGRFDLPADRETQRSTERALSAFSARAQGEGSGKGQPGNPSTSKADVLSSLVGAVVLRDGVASTSSLIFRVPGADADLKGTYALVSGSVHLTGRLRMESDISHAATGWKSILLKPFAPFFKGKHSGTVVAIAVTGTPDHYKVGQDVLHTK